MTQTTFELLVNAVECLWISYFLFSYLGCKWEDKTRACLSFAALWAIEFIQITVTNYITFFEGMGNYLTFILRFLYSVWLLKGNLLFKAWMSAITQIILILSALIGNLLTCFVLNYSPVDMITVFGWQRVTGVCFVQILHFIVSFFILKTKTSNPIKSKIWYCLIIVPLLSALVGLQLFPIVFEQPQYLRVILLALMSLVPLNALVYYFYTVISRDYDNKLKISILEIQNKNAESQIEQTEAFVEQMRVVRHDIRNHLTVISSYVESGKTDDALQYIKEFDTHIPLLKEFVTIEGDPALEAVINSKIAICNQKRIFTQVHLSPDAKLSLDSTDTVTLFGNVLDNAINAAVNSSSASLSVSVTKKGHYTSVLVCNSIDSSVLDSNPNLETTSLDKTVHGIGIKSIRHIVNKYNGLLDFYEENGEFCCHILI